jgi:tetratricopeptide (TPR) repeat protein
VTGGARGAPGRALAALLALGLMAAAAGSARADRIDEAWKRGNDAYFKGDYAEALGAYEQLDRQGVVSADLFYNLGVAHFRMGNLGRAIWAFERATALEPEAEDARFNLAQARKQAERRAIDKIEGAQTEPVWIRIVTTLPVSTQTWLFLLLYVGCFGLLFVRRRAAEDLRAPLGAAAALLGLGAALAGTLLAGRAALDRIPFGVVLPDEVAVKEGADPNYRTSFEVHAGLRVRLLEREQDWIRIRLANGLEGWVREGALGRL